MRRLLVLIAILLCLPVAGYAQLAQSFYNITNVKTDVLPNAIRITVETDGNVDVEGEGLDFLEPTNEQFSFRFHPARRFRLRFIGAKAKIPAFIELGKYPADSVNVTIAHEKFQFSIFRQRSTFDPLAEAATPALDLEFRFYVPISATNFYFGSDYSYVLQPLEMSIARSPDRRSIIITVVTDRVESNRNVGLMKRSPPEQWKHHLKVTSSSAPTNVSTRFTVDALHAPLSEILDQVAQATHLRLAAQPDAADRDITLFLPNTNLPGLTQALAVAYGLSATERPQAEGGGLLVGTTGATLLSERLPIHYSSAENLRTLLPDFLLPHLRADIENNALVVIGSRALIDKVRADVARLDQPPAQVRVEAQAFEINNSIEDAAALSALFSQGKVGFNTDSGTVAVLLTDAQKEQYQATLTALVARGKAKLSVRPSVVVQSGSRGTLFLGQTRFLEVLISSFYGPVAQVIQIPVGTTMTVTPTAIADPNADILLNVAPRFSTVDAIELGTGLPTLGIREIQATLRVRPGDTILIAGLLSENQTRTRQGIFGVGAKRHNRSSTMLAVFVTAKRVTGG